jgi:hypothetical protein
MRIKSLKKGIQIMLCIFMGSLLFSSQVFAEEMSNQELMQELKATQKRLELLENLLKNRVEKPRVKGEQHKGSSVGVKSLDDRVRRLEKQSEENPLLGTWAEKITLSGLIEVEGSYEGVDYDDPGTPDEDSSDITLATVELGIDADITKYVGGHVLFLWEDGDDSVGLDEGFIIFDGEDVVPLYINIGQLYVPFGNFESHFISDPLTLEIGETSEGAVKAGYTNEWVEACVSVYNGDVDEAGDEDNHIDDFVASINITPTISEDFSISFGVSYISNIAESDGLEDETSGTIEEDVAGMGAFASIAYKERFFLELEYVSAIDNFHAGDLSFDNGSRDLEPETWNIEFAFLPTEDLELAVRYEGGNDLGDDFLPDTRYGGIVSYSLFEATNLAVEYLHSSYDNNDESDTVTVQLGVEF